MLASPLEQTDKSLYAYCDNNPVSRKDDRGGFWHIVIGAAVGAVVNFAASIVTDVITGEDIDWTGAFISAGVGAVEGGLTAAGAPVGVLVAVSAVAGAGESVYKDVVKDDKGLDDIGEIVGHAAINAGISALFAAMGSSAEGQRMNKQFRAAKKASLALKSGGLNPSVKKMCKKSSEIYEKTMFKFFIDYSIEGFCSALSENLLTKYAELVYDGYYAMV